jgi:hypothetical protein
MLNEGDTMNAKKKERRDSAAMMEEMEGRVLFAMTPSIPIPPPDYQKVIAISQPARPAPSGIIAILIGL